MLPTLRLVQFVALGSPLWLLSLAFPGGWIAGASYLGLLALVCLADYRSAPGVNDLEAERETGRFSLGGETMIRVSLKSVSTHLLRISIRDELPSSLQLLTPLESVEVSPKAQCEWTYKVRSIRRGRYQLNGLVIRAGRPGALMEKQLRIPAQTAIRIYPRFATTDEYRLLARMSQHDDAFRRRRRAYGRGTDFESLSTYYPGDDLRNVDWKISAKRGYFVSRNLQTERGQQISVMIDGGRLMAETIGEYSRFEHALNAAVMLSYVAQKRGDFVAVSTFSDRIESFVPPTRGAEVMRRVLESLCTVQVRQVESDYWQVVGQVLNRLKRRSLLIMMTDVLDSSSSTGLMGNLIRAASRHLVLCVALTEPRIAVVADSEPEDLRHTYLKTAACHLTLQRQLALETMRSRGIMVLEVPPENLTIHLIRRYLEIRKANLQ